MDQKMALPKETNSIMSNDTILNEIMKELSAARSSVQKSIKTKTDQMISITLPPRKRKKRKTKVEEKSNKDLTAIENSSTKKCNEVAKEMVEDNLSEESNYDTAKHENKSKSNSNEQQLGSSDFEKNVCQNEINSESEPTTKNVENEKTKLAEQKTTQTIIPPTVEESDTATNLIDNELPSKSYEKENTNEPSSIFDETSESDEIQIIKLEPQTDLVQVENDVIE